MSHWIFAPVVLPACIAALMVLVLRNRLAAQRLASLASILVLNGIALALLHAASATGPEAYFLGDWPAPFGITLVLDRLSALMVALLAALALPVTLAAIGSGLDAKGAHFHPLLQFLLMGLAGAFLTGDAFNLFVFFEVLLIASYGLMVHGGGEAGGEAGGGARIRAGLHYVGYNLVGSALFLFALGLLYGVTGTLNLADLAVKLPTLPQGDQALLRVAAVMLILVFAMKGALVPLHVWLPATYANAPLVVAALFAIMTKVGAYATLRVTTLVFPPDLAATGLILPTLLLPAALVTLGLGAIGTLGATTLPRLAGFAGIASMGTVFLGIAQMTPGGTASALYYLLHSTLATALLFLVADLLSRRRAHLRLDTSAPIARPGPTKVLFLAAAVALAGLPPLSGFIGKLLILDAWREQASVVWPAILVSSFLMILGLSRAGSLLFWKSTDESLAASFGTSSLAKPILASSGSAVTGHPTPGHPTPGHPTPGHPTPGHPTPGLPNSSRAITVVPDPMPPVPMPPDPMPPVPVPPVPMPPGPPPPQDRLVLAAAFALLAGLVALTVFAGPATDWLTRTAVTLSDPQAYIAANRLKATP